MPCNPNNPKARDGRYECNPLTNRWVLIKTRKEKTKEKVKEKVKEKTKEKTKEKVKAVGRCNPGSRKAWDGRHECNPLTNRWVLIKTRKEKTSYPTFKQFGAIKQVVRAVKTKAASTWNKTCKEMENTCPMETDLSGDPWCSLSEKDVFYYKKDGKHYCYGVNEIFSIIHLGFTARDTSYEVPPLRLQLPRDSYDRTPFTADFMKKFRDHVRRHRHIPEHPEVCYFLKHVDGFYNDRAIVPFLTQSNPAKVPLSNAIDNFLMRHREMDINLHTDKWEWMPGKRPVSIIAYLSS